MTELKAHYFTRDAHFLETNLPQVAQTDRKTRIPIGQAGRQDRAMECQMCTACHTAWLLTFLRKRTQNAVGEANGEHTNNTTFYGQYRNFSKNELNYN